MILSGMGEPFVHPEIYEIIEDVKRRGLRLTIITNLVLADAARVADLGVDELLIGIHGASRESYEAFHPSFRNGEWERLHAQLELFASRGKRHKHVHVICQTNAHELVEMVQMGQSHGAGAINFKLASLRNGTERSGITGAQREAILTRSLPEARELAKALRITTNLDVFETQLLPGGRATSPIEITGCFMGYVYARITVEGDVLYCCDPEIKVGTLSGGTHFSELWHGQEWQALRNRLREGSYLPGCSQCGKYNQNVSLARTVELEFGLAKLREVTGRG
ncbi:MAG: radical SAM protein [Thermoanaerobaculia bacterium]|nr:radical SAM protein [Thermoanaerobaculia bacterium]